MNLRSTLKKLNEQNGLQSLLLSVVIFILLLTFIWLVSNLLNLHVSNHLPIHDYLYLNAQIFLTLANSLLLIILMARYLENFLKFKTRFTLAFAILALVLLVHSITADPLFFSYFGYTLMKGPFSIIPTMFTFIAVLTLIYLDTR